MLRPVFRQPDMAGPPVVFHYLRAEDGARTPVWVEVAGLPRITDPALVETMTNELFARDAAYAKAQAALGPMFPNEAGDPQGAGRIDSDGVVSLLLPADQQPERWLEVAVAVGDAAPDEVQAGTVAVEWVS